MVLGVERGDEVEVVEVMVKLWNCEVVRGEIGEDGEGEGEEEEERESVVGMAIDRGEWLWWRGVGGGG